MQALLSRYKWSWEELRGLLPGLAQEVLRHDPADLTGPGLAFDETADLRKGMFTACVSPQHAGVTGKVENCVTWVFAALVTAFGQAWIDFDVYMPDCWATDPQRRAKARIPGKLAFATKPELAIAQAFAPLVAGDQVRGRRVTGSTAVPRTQPMPIPAQTAPVSTLGRCAGTLPPR
jgi:SRSO17 transposase